MKFLRCILLVLFLSSVAVSSNEKESNSRDIQVVNLVLRDAVLKGMVDNWGVKPAGHYAVLADHSVEPLFPQSAEQALREAEASKRISQGETADPSEYLFGDPDSRSDWILPEGRVIPKEVIADLQKRSKSRSLLPSVSPGAPLRLVTEKKSVIDSTFRPFDRASTFHKIHPDAVGVIEISLPGYSSGHNVAGLYFSRLRVGLGGGGFFVLLRRSSNVWQIEWIETVWIE